MSPWEIRINNPYYPEQSVRLNEGSNGIAVPDYATGGEPHLIMTAGRRRGESVLRLCESPGGDINSRIRQQIQYDEITEHEKHPNLKDYSALWGVTEAKYTP